YGARAPAQSVEGSLVLALGRSTAEAEATYTAQATGGLVAFGGSDRFRVAVNPGDALEITTATPGDGPDEPGNGPDPGLELYRPAGTPAASNDNGGGAGRNARLTYTDPTGAGGNYQIVVRAASGIGDYALIVRGATGSLPPFRVAASTPADGALLAGFPAT